MHILMIAPEPFLEPRGTPFSVYHRAKALGLLGHTIDLVAYPIGKDVSLPRVHVYRAWRIPFIQHVKIGPSLAKLPLDALLFLRALGLLLRRHYDCIHTHEEAGVFGGLISWAMNMPHIYDMHSDLAQQMTNFQFTCSQFLIKMMRAVERFIVRSASVVIVICPELQEVVAALAPGKPVVLIENTAVAAQEVEQSANQDQMAARIERLRRELALPAQSGPLLVYTGTFESYQGLDLLIASMPEVLAAFPQATYILVGGQPDQAAALAEQARRLGVSHALRLPGQRPPEEMPLFMQIADILLSPRNQGTNTPLKIYSYLHAGKPLLATNIRSHTQVLTADVAVLVDPTREGLTQGTIALLSDSALRNRLAANAQALAVRSYSYETFLAQTARPYDLLTSRVKLT
jgi:glycosyltransferase involved in cell wall biosynthesis